MVKILDPKPGETVYDPACGTGGMLIEAIRNMDNDRRTYGKIYGQEKNLATSAIARMNLFLHGARDFKIEQGDTLRSPLFLYRGDSSKFRLCYRKSAIFTGEVGSRTVRFRRIWA